MSYLSKAILASMIVLQPLQSNAIETVPPSAQVDHLFALEELQADFWQFYVGEFPELASQAGIEGRHDLWTDFSPEARYRRQKEFLAFHDRLLGINREALSKIHQFQFDVLDWLLAIEESKMQYGMPALAIDQLFGIHLCIPDILKIPAQKNSKGYEDLLARMRTVPIVIDQFIGWLEDGVRTGIVAPKIVMQSIPQQILAQISMDPEKSEFFEAFHDEDAQSFRTDALQAIQQKIYPAYQKLYQFMQEEYIPACRETVGLSDLPGGDAGYAHLVKEYTTTSLTPYEIHQLGLQEVNRIKAEMEATIKETGFIGTNEEFVVYLKNDPRFYHGDKNDLLGAYAQLLKKIESQLPLLFQRELALPCEVVAVPDYAAGASVVAYYNIGSIEQGRPGRFFANVHHLKDHPKWGMEALALHEALPGHHYHCTMAQLADIPKHQRLIYTIAFIEGWGLYSESLGKELGFYKDPHSYYGRLSYEMLRALRLVVDTGLHAFGWTRQQAIDYYKQNLPISEREIINEIDRYIVMPAQALAYKVGELKILSLRKQLEEREGPEFDIRHFHAKLLELGLCVPLEALDRYME